MTSVKRRATVHSLAVSLAPGVGGWPWDAARAASAQGNAPPEVSRVVVADPLIGARFVRPRPCPTGRASGGPTMEGFQLKVRGACLEGRSDDARASTGITGEVLGLEVADGEVRVDFRVASGVERALLGIATRVRQGWAGGVPDTGNVVAVLPASGSAAVATIVGGQGTVSASQDGLDPILDRTGWNTLTVRMQLSRMWVLLNGRPILAIEDAVAERGGIALYVSRTEDPTDAQEVSVVFSDLRVSTLDGSMDDRAPTYKVPS